jgi:hypothetical protein
MGRQMRAEGGLLKIWHGSCDSTVHMSLEIANQALATASKL